MEVDDSDYNALRVAVATEVLRAIRKQHPSLRGELSYALLELLDKPDAWWKLRRNDSVIRWAAYLLDRVVHSNTENDDEISTRHNINEYAVHL